MLKAIYIFNTIYQNNTSLLHRIWTKILKLVWNHKRPRRAKVILKKKTKAGSITIPDLSFYYKAVIIKAAWYWRKNRHIDQWNRIENPELDSQIHSQLIFNKAGKNIQWRKDSLFNKCWEKWTPTCRIMNLDHFLTADTKINSKWMKGLNVRQEAIKILEKKAGKNLFDLGHSNFLLNTSPGGKGNKSKNELLGPHQDKKLLHSEGNSQQN